MKYILLLLNILITCKTFAQCGNMCNITDLPASLQTGLVAYYPFCGNANDNSGNHYDATVFGATLATDRFGNPSSAYYFNGISDYMAASPISQYFTNYNISMAAWVKHIGYNTSVAQYLVSIGNDRQNGFAGLGFSEQSQNPWIAAVDPFVNNGWMDGKAGYPIPQQNWHFVVMTFDNDNATLSLYVDCILDTAIDYISFNNVCNDSIRIGKHPNPGYPYFMKGYIDDVMIYNRVLSSSEISQLCPGVSAASFISSDTTFCDEGGKCIDFFDRSVACNPTAWKWSFPGAIPNFSNQKNPTNICYTTPGTYVVTLIVTDAAGSDTLTVSPMITVGGTPPAPTITTVGTDTLVCSHASSYQWFFNGNIIPAATDSFYIATQAGSYNVQITDNLGCSRLSNSVLASVEGIDVSVSGFEVYPNPAGNQLTVYGLQFTAGMIEIYNVLAEKVYQSKPQTSNLKPQTAIDISSLPKGVYLLQLKNDHRTVVKRFVKE